MANARIDEARGFVPERLRQALQRNTMTAKALAQAIGVNEQTIGRYLKRESVPKPAILRAMAEHLGEPIAHFLRPPPMQLDRESPEFFRSYSAATKRARLAAARLKDRSREVTAYLEEHVELPPINFPDLDTSDPLRLSERAIEDAAAQTRRFWGLGDGPIANLVQLLEHNGAVVVCLDFGVDELDAFSQWGAVENRPFIILGQARGSPVRSRFNAAHELAHMVLHRHLDRDAVALPEMHKLLEKQANRFAGAFLLPAASFARSVYLTSLDALVELKRVWGVAVAAMLVRLSQLGLVTPRRHRRLWQHYSSLGWRQGEPLDDTFSMEEPAVLRHSFEIVVKEVGLQPEQVVAELAMRTDDIRAIGRLPLGFLRDAPPPVRARIRAGGHDVLSFRRRENG